MNAPRGNDPRDRPGRWVFDRIPRNKHVAWGYYKIPGHPWTTRSFVIGRWEYFAAHRVAPSGRRLL